MRVAEDFRYIAKTALNGRWKIAVLVGLIATLLGAVEDMGPEVKVNIDLSNANASFDFAGQTIFSTSGGLNPDISAFFIGSFTYILIASLVMGTIYFILSSMVSVGYAKFNLNLIDQLEASFNDLFVYFSCWKTTAYVKFLQSLYILLWSFLFVIPGIMASFSYAMTEYILAENPELSASEAIRISKQLMEGNRWRLFCLKFSFIGWDILCKFTFGIGNLWLNPYKQAAIAAFYREVSRTEYNNFY